MTKQAIAAYIASDWHDYTAEDCNIVKLDASAIALRFSEYEDVQPGDWLIEAKDGTTAEIVRVQSADMIYPVWSSL